MEGQSSMNSPTILTKALPIVMALAMVLGVATPAAAIGVQNQDAGCETELDAPDASVDDGIAVDGGGASVENCETPDGESDDSEGPEEPDADEPSAPDVDAPDEPTAPDADGPEGDSVSDDSQQIGGEDDPVTVKTGDDDGPMVAEIIVRGNDGESARGWVGTIGDSVLVKADAGDGDGESRSGSAFVSRDTDGNVPEGTVDAQSGSVGEKAEVAASEDLQSGGVTLTTSTSEGNLGSETSCEGIGERSVLFTCAVQNSPPVNGFDRATGTVDDTVGIPEEPKIPGLGVGPKGALPIVRVAYNSVVKEPLSIGFFALGLGQQEGVIISPPDKTAPPFNPLDPPEDDPEVNTTDNSYRVDTGEDYPSAEGQVMMRDDGDYVAVEQSASDGTDDYSVDTIGDTSSGQFIVDYEAVGEENGLNCNGNTCEPDREPDEEDSPVRYEG